MRLRPRAQADHPRFDDRGVALVELALVAPVLILLLLGILDYGFLYRQASVATATASSSARVAASAGTYRYADYEALRAVEGGISALRRIEVRRVIVYKADASAEVPKDCLDIDVPPGDLTPKGVDHVCNVYSDAQAAQTSLVGFPSASVTSPTCAPGSWDGAWCPLERRAPTPGTTPDRIGVYVELAYEPLTGVVGVDDFTFDRQTVYQIEPCIDGLSLGECPL